MIVLAIIIFIMAKYLYMFLEKKKQKLLNIIGVYVISFHFIFKFIFFLLFQLIVSAWSAAELRMLILDQFKFDYLSAVKRVTVDSETLLSLLLVHA